MQISDLKDRARLCGIAGAGGAGFPAYAKLNEKADIIVLNCAECEPLFKQHRQLLEKYTIEILSTLELISKTIDAKFIVGIKEEYKKAVAAVKSNIDSFEHGSISLIDEIYPAGDEVVLIYETTGRRVKSGGLPIDVGVTVFNVETVLNMYYAYKAKTPVTYKYVTVAGEVENPQTLRVPVGTEFSHLIKLCGGVTESDTVIISGGPMTGRISDENDTVTKTTNGILVMPSGIDVVTKRQQKSSNAIKRAMSTCCHCRMCTELCPRHQLGHPIEPHAFMNAISNGINSSADVKALVNSQYCCDCGVCELYACFQGLSPRTLISEFKNGMRAKGIKFEQREPSDVDPMREYKKIPVKRVLEKLGLSKYDVPAPIIEECELPGYLKISLRQNIGVPAVTAVSEKDEVLAGQVIAEPAEGLSMPIHSPVDGTIDFINDKFIRIKVKK